MPQTGDQLVVREHERLLCRLSAQFRVDDSHITQIAVSRNFGEGAGALACTIVDCSRGGLGLETGLFLPRSAKLLVMIQSAGAIGSSGKFELACRVQRVAMTDRKPTYYLGLAFLNRGDTHDLNVNQLLTLAAAARATAPAVTDPRTTQSGAMIARLGGGA